MRTRHSSVTRGTRLVLALIGGLALTWWLMPAASAHVRVDGTPAAGGYGVLTFRVPTESDTASTVGLEVTLPADTPFASVSVQPKTGWEISVTRATLPQPSQDSHGNTIDSYAATVTWTATDGGIAPGEFDTFAISVGPFPAVAQLALPALQTYSDGSKVNWSELSSGGAEPEHPAPTITIAAASTGAHDSAPPATTAPMDMSHERASGNGVAIVALIVGVLGLALGVAALVRAGGPREQTPPE